MNKEPVLLLVDDDTVFSESNKDLLEPFGYEVHIASNGAAGLAMAKEIKPDLMILDVMMATDTEGFEVARKIPDSPELKDMKILLVTGIVEALHLPEGLRPDETWLPVDKILEKPIPPGRLIKEVEKILRDTKGQGA